MLDHDERADLINGLTGPHDADAAVRLALEAGASFTLSPDLVPVDELIRTYERRLRWLGERGITTIGSDTVVVRLRAFEGSMVRLGSVHARFNFVLFLDSGNRVVSCLGSQPGLTDTASS